MAVIAFAVVFIIFILLTPLLTDLLMYHVARGLSPEEQERLLAQADPELRAILTKILFLEPHPRLDRRPWEDRATLTLRPSTIDLGK